AEVARYADGVIVGSAFVRPLLDAYESGDATGGIDALARVTADLADGVRSAVRGER
ncbi:tryptophan synthase subunit alpha, partial [Cellulomonas septica]|nr:tryptophan synthase subunit alpha [Cellulomonas septica]